MYTLKIALIFFLLSFSFFQSSPAPAATNSTDTLNYISRLAVTIDRYKSKQLPSPIVVPMTVDEMNFVVDAQLVLDLSLISSLYVYNVAVQHKIACMDGEQVCVDFFEKECKALSGVLAKKIHGYTSILEKYKNVPSSPVIKDNFEIVISLKDNLANQMKELCNE